MQQNSIINSKGEKKRRRGRENEDKIRGR